MPSSEHRTDTTVFDPSGIRIICTCGHMTPYADEYDDAFKVFREHRDANE